MKFKSLFSTLLFLIISANLHSQALNDKIQTAYNNFSKLDILKNGWASLTVIDNKSGKVLFENNSQTGLPTASTLKVITAITALDILGEDYTFNTKLYYTGDIDSLGILHGNIIIEGGGDPSLGSDRIGKNESILVNEWAEAIKELGITCIDGNIIGDDRLYKGYQAPDGYSWSDLGNYYGAGLSSLNWRENKIGLAFTAQKIGESTVLKNKDARYDYLTFVNETTTGQAGSGDNVYGFCAPYSNIIFLRGTYGVDLKKTIEVSSPNPAQDVAYALYTRLEKDSILTTNAPTALNPLTDNSLLDRNKTLLMTHESPPLKELIYWFNQKSINLYGEALLIAIGRLSIGKTGFRESGLLVQKYWNQKLGIPLGEINMYDGSGLSQQNRVTTKAIAQIMQYAKTKKWYTEFEKSLPTINQMTMKSGTIGGTLGYTGYQQSKNGDDVTFSLLVNNYSGSTQNMRQKMFNLLDTLK